MHENTEIRRGPSDIYCLSSATDRPRFRVVAAGIAFFHVTDSTTGRVRGFRRRHSDACELARFLES
nr:hypothetical protein [Pseudomonas shirazensis]